MLNYISIALVKCITSIPIDKKRLIHETTISDSVEWNSNVSLFDMFPDFREARFKLGGEDEDRKSRIKLDRPFKFHFHFP